MLRPRVPFATIDLKIFQLNGCSYENRTRVRLVMILELVFNLKSVFEIK